MTDMRFKGLDQPPRAPVVTAPRVMVPEPTRPRTIEKAIGLAVQRERRRQRLTTMDLAERVGISQAQISRLENGRQGFRSSTLDRIARALRCELIVTYGGGTAELEPAGELAGARE